LFQVFVMSERNRFLQPMGWASGIFENLVTLDCNHHTRHAVHGKRARPIALARTQQHSTLCPTCQIAANQPQQATK
jgi:hypothetical protein